MTQRAQPSRGWNLNKTNGIKQKGNITSSIIFKATNRRRYCLTRAKTAIMNTGLIKPTTAVAGISIEPAPWVHMSMLSHGIARDHHAQK